MADTPQIESVPAAAKKSRSKLPMIAAVFVALALGAGGWAWHRRTVAQATHGEQTQNNPAAEVKSVLHLESFVVNLQGGDNDYLRVGIDLGLASGGKEGGEENPPVGPVRDAILRVLATQTVDDMLSLEGRTKLKQDILREIDDRVPEIQCKEVYFTEFLVQH